MSEDLVNIEINGIPLQARKGAMLIEVADEAGIRIPRFCYHKKLSVAANCRMCLVEVEKAPKPMPACATPVMDGMKAFTHSPRALAAQKGTMEFLLINHPLDCPICDQGGECELQDVAMGYGEDVSRYTEAKRVVRDKDIGPLIATEMTRCIHCTRCVRFGEEIAGIRELGATGRGEFMQIGTFIEKSVTSEMSGNVIDLCPVGALTAKPSRYTARPWELVQHPSVAPHDSMGSNLFIHTREGRVMRVVPRDNESVNETWISDRDRFSYTGLYAADRLQAPMVKDNGKWAVTDWETALTRVVEGMGAGTADQVGALLSPHATLEELYVAQKFLRGMGVTNIDHRLRQSDFSHAGADPLFPYLGLPVEGLERVDAALLVGSNVRKEQPIAHHRLRKATMRGDVSMMAVNTRDYGFAFPMAEQIIADPQALLRHLAGVAVEALEAAGAGAPASLADVLAEAARGETERAMAGALGAAGSAVVLLGSQAMAHPQASLIRALCAVIAEHTGAVLGHLPDAANSAGAWLAGAVPHRGPAGAPLDAPGRDAAQMLGEPCRAYLLLGVEPDLDCADGPRGRAALEAAEFVVSLDAFASDALREVADVLLPVAAFAETSGTFVNAEGRWQSFRAAAQAPGEARPAWKVFRVLGNMAGLPGFDFVSSEQVRDELKARFGDDVAFDNRISLEGASFDLPPRIAGLQRAGGVAIYGLDPLVRRSGPLQNTADGRQAGAYICEAQARALDLMNTDRVLVRQGACTVNLDLIIDDSVAMGCVWIPTGMRETAPLGPAFGPVELQKLQERIGDTA